MRRALDKSRQQDGSGSGGVVTAGGSAAGVAAAAEALDEKISEEKANVPEPPPIMVEGAGAPGAPPMAPPMAPALDAPPLITPRISKSKWKASVKMKPFHWIKMDPSDIGKDSCWNDISNIPVNLEVAELESWFAAKPPKVKMNKEKEDEKDAKKIRTAKEEVNLVDPKRAYHIDIVLSRMRVTYASIRDAILYMDEVILHPEKLQSLIQCCPTPEEIETVKAYLKTDGGDPLLLNKTGKFFYTLSSIKRVRNVASLQSRLELFLFKQQFQSMIDTIDHDIQTIILAIQECRTSQGLKQVLAIILHMGNFINSGSRIGDAQGFKLSTLNQLRETKSSVNPASSLLDYLIQYIEARTPHLKQLVNELTHVKKAASIESSAMSNDITSIGTKLKGLTTALQVPNISAKQIAAEKEEQNKIEKNLKAIKKQHEKKRAKEMAHHQEKLAKQAKKQKKEQKRDDASNASSAEKKPPKQGFIGKLFGRIRKESSEIKEIKENKENKDSPRVESTNETSISRSDNEHIRSSSISQEKDIRSRDGSKASHGGEPTEEDPDVPLPASAVPTHNSSWEDIEPSAYDSSQDHFESVMLKFVTTAQARYQTLLQRHTQLQQELHKLYQFFGEPTETMSSQEFFTKFDTFLTSFTAAFVKLDRIRTQAAKDEKRKLAEAEMRSKFGRQKSGDGQEKKGIEAWTEGRKALRPTSQQGQGTQQTGVTPVNQSIKLNKRATSTGVTAPAPVFQSVKLRPPPPSTGQPAPIPEVNPIADAARKLKPSIASPSSTGMTGSRSSFSWKDASAVANVTPLSPSAPPRAVAAGSTTSTGAPIKRSSSFSLSGAPVTGAPTTGPVRPPTPTGAASASTSTPTPGTPSGDAQPLRVRPLPPPSSPSPASSVSASPVSVSLPVDSPSPNAASPASVSTPRSVRPQPVPVNDFLQELSS